MHLFKTSLTVQKTDLNLLTHSTPFGDINFDLSINEKKIKTFKPFETLSFQKSAISSWDIENCHIEFLQTHFKPRIPTSMEVEVCLAGIWRVTCICKESFLSFKTTLNSNSSLGLQSFPESGEGLISIAFNNDEMQLSIGTEDEDYLDARAHLKKWMPHHFSKEIFESSIKLLSNGIEISLPSLKEKDFIQIQFVVAWSLKKKHNETSCWFAVEQSPEYILKKAGCI